ncbi:hypothetical protein GCM10011390_24740 [Aureimonas endophytica]|uniref:Amidase domain-containing protein n=1 Tax=Aureimonas endophytica TaxID=2027858 RepID=A0A917E5F5_9HYPH|nr:amidase family protein [Aureimonas endophytica]GGE04793.1 hypothetical protein GCM10011390_24740 [Aureimonas endophytica]
MRDMVLVGADLWRIFEVIDAPLTPTLPGPPKPLGSFPLDHDDVDRHFEWMLECAPFAPSANVSGFRALTLPFGEGGEGLPLPVQILGPLDREHLLLALAARLEAEDRWGHSLARLSPFRERMRQGTLKLEGGPHRAFQAEVHPVFRRLQPAMPRSRPTCRRPHRS